MNDQEVLNFTVDVAKRAGAVLLDHFGGKLTRTIKSHQDDFVTEADLASEKLIIEAIKREFPDDAIVAEESGRQTGSSEYTWIIDPLDGTYNFAHGQQNYFVMIARARGSELVLSVVYNPARQQLGVAVAHQGTTLNGKTVVIPDTDRTWLLDGITLRELDVAERAQELKIILLDRFGDRFGSKARYILGALQYQMSVRVETPPGKVWDHAPRALLLTEAGLTLSNWHGEPYVWHRDPGFVAATPSLLEQTLSLLNATA